MPTRVKQPQIDDAARRLALLSGIGRVCDPVLHVQARDAIGHVKGQQPVG